LRSTASFYLFLEIFIWDLEKSTRIKRLGYFDFSAPSVKFDTSCRYKLCKLNPLTQLKSQNYFQGNLQQRRDTMMSALKYLLTVSLAGLLVTACAGTKVNDSWSSQDYKGKIKNVYIIGIAKNELNRMIFENTFIRRLSVEGVKATPSFPDLPKDREADRETIIRNMKLNGADSVLLTRVTDQRTTASFTSGGRGYSYAPGPALTGGSQTYERRPSADSWNNYYSRGYSVVLQAPTTTNLVVMTVESVLYDLRTEELIWSARMETDLESNLEDMIKKFVTQAVKELKGKGFI
jgi:hypothetical protein